LSRATPALVGPGQEHVWDLPRSSIAQPVGAHLVVSLGGRTIAETRRGVRTIESSHPPTAPVEIVREHVAFYAAAMDACFVDGERVQAQPGGFYGGWTTSRVSGPFKGVPGSQGW
jgi:uncharacterized protein (DUF427 family)